MTKFPGLIYRDWVAKWQLSKETPLIYITLVTVTVFTKKVYFLYLTKSLTKIFRYGRPISISSFLGFTFNLPLSRREESSTVVKVSSQHQQPHLEPWEKCKGSVPTADLLSQKPGPAGTGPSWLLTCLNSGMLLWKPLCGEKSAEDVIHSLVARAFDSDKSC